MAAAAVTVSASASPATPVTVFITGANSGIGLALVEAYAKAPHTRVIGTARDVQNATALQALAAAHTHVSVLALDVSDSKSVAALPGALAALHPPVKALDVLINNAGIVSGVKGHNGFSSLADETIENLIACFRTNCIGAWDVTNRLLPLLRLAATKQPKLIHISSTAGQFACTLDGPGLALGYRTSKSAMNQLAAVQSREYNAQHVAAHAAAAAAPGDAKLQAAAAASPALVTVLAVNPGVVDTPILAQVNFRPPQQMLKTAAESAHGIVQLIATVQCADGKAKFLDAISQKELTW